MNLYEIDDKIKQAFEGSVDLETGEIIDLEAYEALNSLQMDFNEKAEGILLWIKNLKAEAEALKKEKQAFEARQKAATNRAESLTRYISGVLNGDAFKTSRVSATWRKSEAVEYTGEVTALPEDCLRLKDPEIDKTELKRLLKSGVEIPGAQVIVKNNIQIR